MHKKHGELVVTGQGKVEVELGHHHPKTILVEFVNDTVLVPCNPHHRHHLKWELINKHQSHHHDIRHEHCNHDDEYILIIHWEVAGYRVIEWKIG